MSLEGKLINQNDEIAAKQSALAGMLDGITDLTGTKAADRVAEVRQANQELADLAAKRDETQELVNIEKAAKDAVKITRQGARLQTGGDQPEQGEQASATKSLGDLIREAGVKSGFRGSLGEMSHAEAMKTLSTTADMSPQTQRLPLVLDAQESRTTADLMLQGTTSAAAIEYYEETTFTNAAVEVDEGGLKPEAAVDFTLRTDAVRKIAVWVPVTDEMLADNAGFESYLRGRLGFMVKQREERQLLVGDGTAPNISGILDRSGVQTQALGTDTRFDAIFKAISKVRNVGFAEPTAIVIHPNDWEPMVLDKYLEGRYLIGNPASETAARVWGLEVRVTSQITEGTALVGAFRPDAQIFRKGGLELAISDSHSDYFIYNKQVIRVEERVAAVWYRASAFCLVTGI